VAACKLCGGQDLFHILNEIKNPSSKNTCFYVDMSGQIRLYMRGDDAIIMLYELVFDKKIFFHDQIKQPLLGKDYKAPPPKVKT
jgi:hypothetical protein